MAFKRSHDIVKGTDPAKRLTGFRKTDATNKNANQVNNHAI